jgi:hypothetical protein
MWHTQDDNSKAAAPPLHSTILHEEEGMNSRTCKPGASTTVRLPTYHNTVTAVTAAAHGVPAKHDPSKE